MKEKFHKIAGLILAIMFFLFVILAVFGSVMIIRGQTVPCVLDTLDNGSYQTVYSRALLVPISADWVLAKENLGKSQREPSWRFSEDLRVPSPRATHADYTGSGFDRGHLCPAADRSADLKSVRSTFIMTNVCPQAPALNRGAWKRLEEACRAIARHGQALSIHVDAVFWKADTQRIGRHRVAVPHGFVKTIRDFLTDTICFSKYFCNE